MRYFDTIIGRCTIDILNEDLENPMFVVYDEMGQQVAWHLVLDEYNMEDLLNAVRQEIELFIEEHTTAEPMSGWSPYGDER